MSGWALKAKEMLPELDAILGRAETPLALWDHLFMALMKAYESEPRNDALIERIYRYAAWCLTQAPTDNIETDVSNAAAVGLIENIPLSVAVRDDLHRWMSEATFQGCEQLFRYHLSDEAYHEFARDFSTKRRSKLNPAVL